MHYIHIQDLYKESRKTPNLKYNFVQVKSKSKCNGNSIQIKEKMFLSTTTALRDSRMIYLNKIANMAYDTSL